MNNTKSINIRTTICYYERPKLGECRDTLESLIFSMSFGINPIPSLITYTAESKKSAYQGKHS